MKKLISITPLLLIIFSLKALAFTTPVCYVKSGDKIYFGQKLKIGLTTAKVIADDGSVVKVPIKEVNSYKNGNRYFETRPTVNKNNEINGNAMMELLKFKSDLKLYRCVRYESGIRSYDYYVFKKDRFHLLLNKENAANVLSFFGIEAQFEL